MCTPVAPRVGVGEGGTLSRVAGAGARVIPDVWEASFHPCRPFELAERSGEGGLSRTGEARRAADDTSQNVKMQDRRRTRAQSQLKFLATALHLEGPYRGRHVRRRFTKTLPLGIYQYKTQKTKQDRHRAW